MKQLAWVLLVAVTVLPFTTLAATHTSTPDAPPSSAAASGHGRDIAHGKWLVDFGGCNDCHTPDWGVHGGHAPKEMLLTGGGFNFQGPWGTTYPVNLRLLAQELTVQKWIHQLRTTRALPPMPWYSFRYLSDTDLADMYAYIHSLGAAGNPAHAYVPPGKPAPAPYLKLVLPSPPVPQSADSDTGVP